MNRLGEASYLDKLAGCWLGKNIGGTLGAPMEWKHQVNNVAFYTQDLHGDPLPNDDLDLQLVWLVALEERGPRITAHDLAEYWLSYITPGWGEYGICKANLRIGLLPPLSGYHRNIWRDSCGSFIRSEIWACITAGHPEMAAYYAYQDAIVDHGGGEGVYAEMFCAAVQSQAFTVSEPQLLIECGLSFIPSSCLVAQAIRIVCQAYAEGLDWQAARSAVHAAIGTERPRSDAPNNVAYVIIGWLYGHGDFGISLCTAVNCGDDTDCTAATLGALLGILGGESSIPKEWANPIGRGIRTISINAGDFIVRDPETKEMQTLVPADIDELASRVARIANQVEFALTEPIPTLIDETDPSFTGGRSSVLQRIQELWDAPPTMVNFDCGIVKVGVDYAGGLTASPGRPIKMIVQIQRRIRSQVWATLHWQLPSGWHCDSPNKSRLFLGGHCLGYPATKFSQEITVIPGDEVQDIYHGVLKITLEGRVTSIFIPLVWLGGSSAE